MSSGAKVRALAAKTIAAVISGGALDAPLANYKKGLSDKDQSFLSALAYGTIRRMPRHQAAIEYMLRNPKKPINPMMRALLALGLEQITATRVPPHAAVSATVAASRFVNQASGSGFLNAILRRYLRDHEAIEEALQSDERFVYQHPQWLIEKFKFDWPDQWQAMLASNNEQPPLWLRINSRRTSRKEYMALLAEQGIEAVAAEHNDVGIKLVNAVNVELLPKFEEGWVSVQDLGAQFAAPLLQVTNTQRVLDACAAPGGKAMHALELCPDAALTALDISAERLEKVQQSCERLGVKADIVAADATSIKDWWNGTPYDSILIDAPCSGTGVIRRHPDIKLLRRPKDGATFAQLQNALITNLWKTLKPGGRMIYATCSVFPEENERAVEAVIEQLKGAQSAPIVGLENIAKSLKYGVQILPGETGTDGFYYAALLKQEG